MATPMDSIDIGKAIATAQSLRILRNLAPDNYNDQPYSQLREEGLNDNGKTWQAVTRELIREDRSETTIIDPQATAPFLDSNSEDIRLLIFDGLLHDDEAIRVHYDHLAQPYWIPNNLANLMLTCRQLLREVGRVLQKKALFKITPRTIFGLSGFSGLLDRSKLKRLHIKIPKSWEAYGLAISKKGGCLMEDTLNYCFEAFPNLQHVELPTEGCTWVDWHEFLPRKIVNGDDQDEADSDWKQQLADLAIGMTEVERQQLGTWLLDVFSGMSDGSQQKLFRQIFTRSSLSTDMIRCIDAIRNYSPGYPPAEASCTPSEVILERFPVVQMVRRFPVHTNTNATSSPQAETRVDCNHRQRPTVQVLTRVAVVAHSDRETSFRANAIPNPLYFVSLPENLLNPSLSPEYNLRINLQDQCCLWYHGDKVYRFDTVL